LPEPSIEILFHGPAVAGVRPRVEEHYATVAWWDRAEPDTFLRRHGAEIRAIVADGSLAIPPLLLEALPNLALIACVGTGFDGMDVTALRRRSVAVTHSPRTNTGDVADFAVLQLLALARGLTAGQSLFWSGEWARGPLARRRALSSMTVGIVGLGAVGLAVAQRLGGFGCGVTWWGPREKHEVDYPRAGSLIELARTSDVLVLALRADQQTVGLIDATIIEAVGREGLIVNVARGSVIDEDSLIAALKEGRLAGAALDVFAAEPADPQRWRDVPNLLATPHMAAGTHESLQAMGDAVLENLRRLFAGEPLFSPVRDAG
jgi:lactate dehydrogenase-like 2-hydroxyacid dehydrogenase